MSEPAIQEQNTHRRMEQTKWLWYWISFLVVVILSTFQLCYVLTSSEMDFAARIHTMVLEGQPAQSMQFPNIWFIYLSTKHRTFVILKTWIGAILFERVHSSLGLFAFLHPMTIRLFLA